MDKADKLEMLELLSALESWGFSNGAHFPDYLCERLANTMEKLRVEILN